MAWLLVDRWWTRALADVQIVRIRRSVERFEMVPEWNFGGWAPIRRTPGVRVLGPPPWRLGDLGPSWGQDQGHPDIFYVPPRPPAVLHTPRPLPVILPAPAIEDMVLCPVHAPPEGRALIQTYVDDIVCVWRDVGASLVGEMWALQDCWVEGIRWVGRKLFEWGVRFLARTLFATRIGFDRVLRGVWPFWI